MISEVLLLCAPGRGRQSTKGWAVLGDPGLVPPGTPRMLAEKRQEPEMPAKGMGPFFFFFASHKFFFFLVLCVTCMC